MMELRASKLLDIRFSEVDSMNVVWHGSYMLYFEDARELFGQKYDLTYMGFFDHGYFAPLVEMNFQWKRPIKYGMRPRIDIIYRPTISAKIVFDYEIRDPEDETLFATGHSVQVFMDTNYQLVLYSPEFYDEWRRRWGVNI
ncbi:MAG: acyl-CoA thioesterase [Prevotella sp.]|nr:acyl-CoA thioesterase [Prevotella sp.]MBQ9204295.1 acyl-CoA thioesterase [Prevotella sp.]